MKKTLIIIGMAFSANSFAITIDECKSAITGLQNAFSTGWAPDGRGGWMSQVNKQIGGYGLIGVIYSRIRQNVELEYESVATYSSCTYRIKNPDIYDSNNKRTLTMSLDFSTMVD